jgi:hypothetical protein
MNYYPKKRPEYSIFQFFSTKRITTFKRREIVVSYVLDLFKAGLYVFGLDIPYALLPMFGLLAFGEFYTACKNEQNSKLSKFWFGVYHFWFIGNIGMAYIYYLRDKVGGSTGKVLIWSTSLHLGVTTIVSLGTVGFGVIGYFMYFCGSKRKSRERERRGNVRTQVHGIAALTLGLENTRRREMRIQKVEESKKRRNNPLGKLGLFGR